MKTGKLIILVTCQRISATTMLTCSYSIAERFRARAVNEIRVFGTTAAAFLLAGTIVHFFGGLRLMRVPVPVLVIVCLARLPVRRDALLHTAESA
jgi:hypothetical protein